MKLLLVAGAVMESILYVGIANVKRESTMYCTRFESHGYYGIQLRINFNGLQQDFDVLILECIESGINVSINTV